MITEKNIPNKEDDFDGNNPVEPDEDESQQELPEIQDNRIDSPESNSIEEDDDESIPSQIINDDVPDEDASGL